MTNKITGFFSYAHFDNRNDCLRGIRDDLCYEYEALTGDELELFFDNKSLQWGAQWKKSIEAGIESASFFIPVLTPHYYLSESCQAEFQQFASKAEELGEPGLILPIHYIDIPEAQRNSIGPLVDEIEQYQWKRFDDLRFLPRDSEQYLRTINEMAQCLSKVNERLITQIDSKEEGDGCVTKNEKKADEEPDFYLESLDYFTDVLPELNEMICSQTDVLEKVSTAMQRGTDDLNRSSEAGGGVKEAIAIAARVASSLRPLAENFELGSIKYMQGINQLDRHARTVLANWRQREKSPKAQEALIGARQMVEANKVTKEQIDGFISVLRKTASLSRSLYKPTKQIERGAIQFSGACSVVIGWDEYLN